ILTTSLLIPNSISFCHAANPLFSPLSLHDALPIYFLSLEQGGYQLLGHGVEPFQRPVAPILQHKFKAVHVAKTRHGREGEEHRLDRKSTRLNSSHVKTSYAACCLKR